MGEKIFVDGMIFKLPSERAPDFIIGKLSIKAEEFMSFLITNEKNGWLNIELKVGQSGKPYAELDTWEPNQTSGQGAERPQQATEKPQQSFQGYGPEDFEDDIPF